MMVLLLHVWAIGAALLGIIPRVGGQQQQLLRHEAEGDDDRALQLTQAEYVGNDGRGPFPLDLCQGDCDNDEECQGTLVCYQRDRGDLVPGCSLGSLIDSYNDFCVKDPNADDDDDDDDNDGDDDDDNGGGELSGPFVLKLYWEEDYYWQVRTNRLHVSQLPTISNLICWFDYHLTWQEESIHREWCVRCFHDCDEGEGIEIKSCSDSPTEFQFIYFPGNETQIKVASGDVCLEADFDERPRAVYLRSCDHSESLQRFVATQGDFRGPRFEISPMTRPDRCLTQHHHPRDDEDIYIETCSRARRADTSYWNMY